MCIDLIVPKGFPTLIDQREAQGLSSQYVVCSVHDPLATSQSSHNCHTMACYP